MGTRKYINKVIVVNPTGTRHQVKDDVFKVTYKIPGNLPKEVCQLHLATTESIVIRLLNHCCLPSSPRHFGNDPRMPTKPHISPTVTLHTLRKLANPSHVHSIRLTFPNG